ncbi:MAG: S9 family peptidase, partial [Acidobacteriota bacterium]
LRLEAQPAIPNSDLLSVEPIASPTLSPDGKQMVFSRDGQLYLMPAEGGWPVALTSTAGGKSSPAWSPDGTMIAYVSQGGIWVVSAAGGPPLRLTSAPAGAGDPRRAADRSPSWNPKGRWILFETGRRGNGDLMVVSADGVTSQFITLSADEESSPSWSPDGTRICYTARSPEYFSGKLRVLRFDLGSGRVENEPVDLCTAPVDRGGGWSIPRAAWTADGTRLAVVLQHSGWDKIYLIPATGGEPAALTTGESEDADPVISPDGKLVAFVSNRENLDERHIWLAPLDGSPGRRLTRLGAGAESGPQWSSDGSKIYFTRSTPLEPSNMMVAGTGAGSPVRNLTNTLPKNFERAQFRMPEEVHYRSKDGLDVAAILYKPRDFKAGVRYPAVLWIHGGPEGQDIFSWDPWAHYLTQEGYIVLQPNYRGSSGYGEKFRNLNVEDSGGGEMDDVAAGAQYLIDQGWADSKRIAIGGGSHGGTMTAYAVVKYPELFAAAVELFGVVDRATYNERTNRNSAIRWMMKMGGAPQEKPEVYRKANVLPDVPKIRTPLLVMHGEQDPQVPPYESAQFVRTLKQHGKKHYYFTYPNEGHGFSQRDHRLDAWKKQLGFLRYYLNPEYGRSITSVDDFVP